MRTDRIAALAAAALLTAPALASCGIPESSAPEVIEPAPTDFGQSSQVEAEEFLPSTEARATVENFLRAAAGDIVALPDRLSKFTENDHDFSEFSESGDFINLLDDVRYDAAGTPDTNTEVITVTGSIVGAYYADGRVRMSPNPRGYEETFELERESLQSAWSVTEPPSQVALLYNQFQESYVESPLYFRAAGEDDLLVPDLRWIYDRLDPMTERRMKLDWLVRGPDDWIEHAVRSAIPSSTVAQISEEDGTVQVDLTLSETADAGSATATAIAAQLAWSLGLDVEFELHVAGEEVASGTLDDWREWNAVPSDPEQIGYFVGDETILQYQNDDVTDFSAEHPWVGFTLPGLRQASVSTNGRIAAVVDDGNGPELLTGPDEETMTAIEGLSGDLRDPQWFDGSRLVVVNDGVLTAVRTVDGTAQALGGESVTAMALSMDGRRLAYVEDGRAWVAPLLHDADGNLLFGVRNAVGLDISEVTDVAWSSEDFLLVAGERARSNEQLFRVSIDNAETEDQDGTSDFPQIQQIATNPADPLEPSQNRGEPTIVSIGSDLYRVHTNTMQLLTDARTGEAIQGSAPFTVALPE